MPYVSDFTGHKISKYPMQYKGQAFKLRSSCLFSGSKRISFLAGQLAIRSNVINSVLGIRFRGTQLGLQKAQNLQTVF